MLKASSTNADGSAITIASELRKLADALDAAPPALVALIEAPNLYLNCKYMNEPIGKEVFQMLSQYLPRPINKVLDNYEYMLKYRSDKLRLEASIERSKVCTLVEPAKEAVYSCEPLLSDYESAAFLRED